LIMLGESRSLRRKLVRHPANAGLLLHQSEGEKGRQIGGTKRWRTGLNAQGAKSRKPLAEVLPIVPKEL
jgi:hypothetical protein